MQILDIFISLPVEQVRIGDEVLDSARMCQFEIFRFILLDLLLSRDVILQLKTWAPVSFILNVEELDGEIVLQIDHCSMVKHYVEVLSFYTPIASKEEVLGISVGTKGALEV